MSVFLVRKSFWLFYIYSLVLFFASFVFPQYSYAQTETYQETFEATVVRVVDTGKETFGQDLVPYQELEMQAISGSQKDQIFVVKNTGLQLIGTAQSFQEYSKGDKLRIASFSSDSGEASYAVEGRVKRDGILTLVLLFVIVVVVVGRLWGALSLIGLATSFLVIFRLIVPLIISGTNPVLAAIAGSLIIIPVTFYISHGFNTKTHVGLISTLITLCLTGFLAMYFVDATHLTGYASEEAGFLQVERRGLIDIRGILLAGIIIGTLGILDDVTVGQASTIQQLRRANPKLKMLELFQKGMKVGQDHISSMVNTLVLVYSGSALPLLLLFFDSEKSFLDILEYELIAEEIVRMLVGSVGLILAAPLASILAAYFFSRQKVQETS